MHLYRLHTQASCTAEVPQAGPGHTGVFTTASHACRVDSASRMLSKQLGEAFVAAGLDIRVYY